MKTNHPAGIDAERLCYNYLVKSGFKVLAERYKTNHGDIDLIARKSNSLIFVEVKRRKNIIVDDPVSNVQKKRLVNSALQYISENPQISELDMRFDCIIVDNDMGLEHITDGWRADL